MPTNGNAKKQVRLEEVRKRRSEVKARKSAERVGNAKGNSVKGRRKGQGQSQGKGKAEGKNKKAMLGGGKKAAV